ncbi:MAG: hypothetical protein M3O35_06455 [Acidobacteriota bacterium]|nr:hypothetical protein [Acidobacteriota bacterium]
MKLLNICFGVIAGTTLAQGQNVVSWVSSTGSDAANCTRVAPCKTFAGAYLKTNSGGAIHVIDAADYGAVIISKPLTIDGAGTAAVIAGASGVHVVKVALGSSDVVTLRNLTIYPRPGGQADPVACGIAEDSVSGTVNVENVAIVMPPGANTIGVCLGQVNLRNVSTTGGTYGVSSSFGAVTAERLSVANASQSGLAAGNGSLTVRDSVFRGNTGSGILVQASSVPTSALIERSEMSLGGTGLIASQNGAAVTVRVSDSVITGNNLGVSALGGGTVITFRTNMIAGNTTDGAPALSTSLK